MRSNGKGPRPPHIEWLTAARHRPVLITGGAGFIGTNLAHRLLQAGARVRIFDNLARAGTTDNLRWLRGEHRERLEVVNGDVRDGRAVRDAVRGTCRVFHFAAQVAVTSSLIDPPADFAVNAHGTVNVLEAVRHASPTPPVLFTSTNKVYGSFAGLELTAGATRYTPADAVVQARGIDERQALEFRSPYGCSKGAADQYMLDYAHTFGVPATVFRMSCIYGPHQFGTEDQGWVAHFLIRAVEHAGAMIYGDGRQVRDILFVDDLVNAFLLAHEHIDRCGGEAFNIGGGPENAISLLDLLGMIRELVGRPLPVEFRDWRPSDQRYYVSDCTKFRAVTGWRPQVGTRDGVARLLAWLHATRGADRALERRAATARAAAASTHHPHP
jgi:CDP-paratose 2-epimerase